MIRAATSEDAESVARLHALSWQSAYRGVLSDDFLDHRVDADRLELWRRRFSSLPDSLIVFLACHEEEPMGFACVMLDEDPRWGAALDNLHVLPEWKGRGIGRKLMLAAAASVESRRPGSPLHLWVVETNREAISFYDRRGGKPLDAKLWRAPDGTGVRLIRYVWNDPTCVE